MKKQLFDSLEHLRALAGASTPGSQGWLKDLGPFGTNPGALQARVHVPAHLPDNPALVVVLHGCTQTAAGYDCGSGWSQLADEYGFIVLFPEQQRANNPNLCFNWFSPADNARDRGEALSIRQMIAALVNAHGIDPARIFVTGLSAGGAMASILLAAYPEVFAGGTIIAGLPYGAASNVPQALEAMRAPARYTGPQLGDRVRRATSHVGPWPKIAIWHGTADATVSESNADAILAQWLSVHGLGDSPDATDSVGGHPHRSWTDALGATVVEDYRIIGMGHGTPLSTTGPEACGTVLPHMLEVGVSSTRVTAKSWGLLDGKERVATAPTDGPVPELLDLPVVRTARMERVHPTDPRNAEETGVEKVIKDALRAAGLLR